MSVEMRNRSGSELEGEQSELHANAETRGSSETAEDRAAVRERLESNAAIVGDTDTEDPAARAPEQRRSNSSDAGESSRGERTENRIISGDPDGDEITAGDETQSETSSERGRIAEDPDAIKERGKAIEKKQEEIDKAIEKPGKRPLERTYKNEIQYTHPEDGDFAKQLKKIGDQQKDLAKHIGELEEKSDQLKSEGKEDTAEYKELTKELDKFRKYYEKNADTLEKVTEMQVDIGLETAEQIRSKMVKLDSYKVNNDKAETRAKRDEAYIEKARDILKDKQEELKAEKSTLGPEGRDRRKEIDKQIQDIGRKLNSLDFALAGVKEGIARREMDKIKETTDKIDKAEGDEKDKLKETLITPRFKNQLELTQKRLEDARSIARSFGKEAGSNVERRPYIPPVVDREDGSEEHADKERFTKDKEKVELLGVRLGDDKKIMKTMAHIREVADSYTPQEHDNSASEERTKRFELVMAGISVVKTAVYEPQSIPVALQDFREQIDDFKSSGEERRADAGSRSDVPASEDKAKENDPLKTMATMAEAKETVTKLVKGETEGLAYNLAVKVIDIEAGLKNGGVLNLKTEQDKYYFSKFREVLDTVGDLAEKTVDAFKALVKPESLQDAISKPFQVFDKMYELEDKIKEWVGTLLEDRYGKSYGAETDFSSNFDRALYDYVSRPDSDLKTFIHYVATIGDTVDGMDEQWKSVLN